jgi:hypothetical protein
MRRLGGGAGRKVWKLEMRPLTPAAGARQLRASDWCGARGRGSQPRTRAASGLRPEALWPPARSWLTEAVRQLRLADVSGPKGRAKAGSRGPEAATKARPDAVRKTPRWSAGRRGASEEASHTKRCCAIRRSISPPAVALRAMAGKPKAGSSAEALAKAEGAARAPRQAGGVALAV